LIKFQLNIFVFQSHKAEIRFLWGPSFYIF